MENAPRPAEDLWRRTLAQIPSTYGRIVHLASLRNVNRGSYEHHGLSLVFGEEAADQAMRESHGRVFQEWLAMDLEQQKADLDLYLSCQPVDRRTLTENWLQLCPYKSLPPAWTTAAERELFDCHLELMLKLLKREYAA
jgi:hypothetical protein